jgi:tetratricopeptide (TPR) repeat protein
LESSPQELRFLTLRAQGLRNLAMALSANGDAVGALRLLRESLDMLETLKDEHPATHELEADLYEVHRDLADTLIALRKTDEALAQYRAAVQLAVAASSAAPSDLMGLWRHAEAYERLGDFYARLATESGSEQGTHSAAASICYARSLTIWDEWTRWGTSSVFDRTRRAWILEARDDSDRSLAALPTEAQGECL